MKSTSWLIVVLIASLTELSACTPPPRYKLIPPTAALSIARGSSQSFTLGVLRLAKYTGIAVVIVRCRDDGVTVTPAQATINGDSQIYTVSVSSSAAIGTAYITLEPATRGYGLGGSVTITVQ